MLISFDCVVLIGSTDGQQSDPIGVPILAFKLRNPKNDKWNENFSFVKVRCSYKNLITFLQRNVRGKNEWGYFKM